MNWKLRGKPFLITSLSHFKISNRILKAHAHQLQVSLGTMTRSRLFNWTICHQQFLLLFGLEHFRASCRDSILLGNQSLGRWRSSKSSISRPKKSSRGWRSINMNNFPIEKLRLKISFRNQVSHCKHLSGH